MVNGHVMLLLVLYLNLIAVYLSLCLPPAIAEHCGPSLPVWKDRNEPHCMMGSLFCWETDPYHVQARSTA